MDHYAQVYHDGKTEVHRIREALPESQEAHDLFIVGLAQISYTAILEDPVLRLGLLHAYL